MDFSVFSNGDNNLKAFLERFSEKNYIKKQGAETDSESEVSTMTAGRGRQTAGTPEGVEKRIRRNKKWRRKIDGPAPERARHAECGEKGREAGR